MQFFNFRFCLHPPHNLPARHSPVNHRSGTDRETRTGRTSSRFWTPGTELKLLCTVSRLCRTCFAVIPMGRDKSNPRRVISARTPWSGAWRQGMHALSVVVLLSVDRGVVCFASRAAVRGIAVCHSLLVMVSPLALSFFFFFFGGSFLGTGRAPVGRGVLGRGVPSESPGPPRTSATTPFCACVEFSCFWCGNRVKPLGSRSLSSGSAGWRTEIRPHSFWKFGFWCVFLPSPRTWAVRGEGSHQGRCLVRWEGRPQGRAVLQVSRVALCRTRCHFGLVDGYLRGGAARRPEISWLFRLACFGVRPLLVF